MKKSSAIVLTSAFAVANGPGLVIAQEQGQNPSALAPIVQALQGLNFTTLASAAVNVSNTTVGQQLATLFTTGQPITLFAPDNNAFTGVPANVTADSNLLAEVLSYHIIPRSTVNLSFFSPTGNTVLRTALNASDQVFLAPAGGLEPPQVLVGDLESDGQRIRILNQDSPVHVYNTTMLNISGTNITLNAVDAVIDIPKSFDSVFQQYPQLTAFRAAAQQAGLLETLNLTHGLTIFAPNNQAFAGFAQSMGGLGSMNGNTSLLNAVLLNHVLNGSVVYSSELVAGANLTTAAGEVLTVSSNASSVPQPSNNASRVLAPSNSTTFSLSTTNSNGTTSNATILPDGTDLISWSGVLHIIDTVLFNNESSPDAASSAYASATASEASLVSSLATASASSGGPGIGVVGIVPAGASAATVTGTGSTPSGSESATTTGSESGSTTESGSESATSSETSSAGQSESGTSTSVTTGTITNPAGTATSTSGGTSSPAIALNAHIGASLELTLVATFFGFMITLM